MIVSSSPDHGVSIAGIEFGLTLITVALVFLAPRLGSVFFDRVERAFGQLARRRGLAIAVVGLSELFLRLALLPLSPIPKPFTPDDFSFLLGGDTFSSGRLTNPTPAMWTHFETVHVSM